MPGHGHNVEDVVPLCDHLREFCGTKTRKSEDEWLTISPAQVMILNNFSCPLDYSISISRLHPTVASRTVGLIKKEIVPISFRRKVDQRFGQLQDRLYSLA